MNKWLIFGLTVFVLFSGFYHCYSQETQTSAPQTSSQESTSSDLEKYVNSEKHYEIEYPKQWQRKEAPRFDLILFITAKNTQNEIHATMNILSEYVGPSVTLDRFYSESLANLVAELKDTKVESSGERTLHDVPSKWVIYTHTLHGLKLRVLQYFIVANDYIYLMTFSALADEFSEYLPDFEKIAASFRMLKAGVGQKETPK
jgi:hypothetical protein